MVSVRGTRTPAQRDALLLGAPVPSLVRWGLTPDADLMFRTIVTMGPRSAGALAAELGLPVRRVEQALAELHAAGAAAPADNQAAGSLSVWAARPGQDVLSALRAGRFRRVDSTAPLRAHHKIVHPLSDRTPSLRRNTAGPGGASDECVRYLNSRELTRQRLAELMAVERHEHLTMNPEQRVDGAALQASGPIDRELVDRGVRLRVLGTPPADGDPPEGDTTLLERPTCAYREALDVPMKLFVIDHRIAFFPADPTDLDRGYLEVSQPGVVKALVMLFEKHWETATDPRECGMLPDTLSDRERELIALLARGHTDVTAAQQLHISARSVTTIMRQLMDRFGVENRFQLGLALGALRPARPASGAIAPAHIPPISRDIPS